MLDGLQHFDACYFSFSLYWQVYLIPDNRNVSHFCYFDHQHNERDYVIVDAKHAVTT